MDGITIDPKSLRNDCLSFGLASSILQRRMMDLGLKEEDALIASLSLTSLILFGNEGNKNALMDTYRGYAKRTWMTSELEEKEFPLWGEEEERIEERLADSFFAPYACFLSYELNRPINDVMGPLLFFSGAIKEDIDEGRNKEEGDPHYDSFAPIIEKVPLNKEDLLSMLISLRTAV